MKRFLSVMMFCMCLVPASASASDAVLLPFILTTYGVQGLATTLGAGFSYTGIGISWTSSPGETKQNPRNELMRSQFIQSHHRELVEDLALGNGPTLNVLVGLYTKDPARKKSMLKQFRQVRKTQQHLLSEGSFKNAKQFDRLCIRFAKASK